MALLTPYTVLDLTDQRGELGPMLLADLGAHVLRVEPPGGSPVRQAQPRLADAPQDRASLSFLAFNRNKQSIVLDPESAADRSTLAQLIERADFLFESAPGSLLEAFGLDFAGAEQLNPAIVQVTVSPFGRIGPNADKLGSDLVIAAMGGPVMLQGTPDKPPVRVSVPQVWRHAGAEAAAASLVAHARMRTTGRAQHVDLAAQCTMTWTMLQAMDAHAIQGFDFERVGASMSGRLQLPLQHACKDGYVIAIPLPPLVQACAPWMVSRGTAPESLLDTDWESAALALDDPERGPAILGEMVGHVQALCRDCEKRELYEFGLAKGVSFAPVNTLSELLASDHIRAREYWQAVRLTDDKTVNAPGSWAKTTGLSPYREAPSLDEHAQEVREWLARTAKRTAPQASGDALPFAGLKVLDYSWVGVGPITTKFLADHGATVVRVESLSRPDVLRGNGPFKDNVMDINRSQFFGDFNTSKLSLALDMKHPGAQEIALQLAGWADVFVESMAPGALRRMGLDYEAVSAVNPSIIMLSTCLMGQTGPAATLAGYGYHAAAIAGFYELTGWPEDEPAGPWTAYTDTIAPRFASTLLAAAIDHRRRTGEGRYIDLAQIEAALHFLAPELLDLQANGFEASRRGNRDRYAAPQGCYPVAGDDQWCAIAVETDAQWVALTNLMGREDLQVHATHDARHAVHAELDDAISAWTGHQTTAALVERLQAAGIPAGPAQRSSDLLQDPGYDARGFYRYLEHQEMGRIPYAGHQYRIEGYDHGPRFAAPTLGQHSYEVLTEVLGLSDEAVAEAYASGLIN